jgi:signal transduction histidine kinase
MGTVEEPHAGPAEWIQTALTGTGIATIVTDAQGTVLFLSPVAESLTGWARGEAIGRPLATVFHTENETTRLPAVNPVAEVLATGAAIGLADHTVLVARDGRESRIASGADVIRDASSVVAAVLIFCAVGAGTNWDDVRDVTDRKRAEDALRKAHTGLETRVKERTAELAHTNESLTAEIARRERAEAERRDLQRRLTTAQEDERRRIARELHDQLGQHLTGLGLGLKVVKDATPHPSPVWDRLHELQALTDRIGREVHQLALQLRPTALDDFGLEAALANYADEWGARSGIEVDFHATGLDAGRLPAATETALYRVILEALTNVLKHARAKRVSVVLQAAPRQVVAVVEDDGCGFDPEAGPVAGAEQRLGILGMRERVALLGGELTIDSGLGRGTTVIARIPLAPATGENHDG